MVIGFLAAAVVPELALFFLELPPDPHAPATIASTSRTAPTAPLRVYRMGQLSSLVVCDRGCPGRISAHLRRRRGARQDGDPALATARQAQPARRDGPLQTAEP